MPLDSLTDGTLRIRDLSPEVPKKNTLHAAIGITANDRAAWQQDLQNQRTKGDAFNIASRLRNMRLLGQPAFASAADWTVIEQSYENGDDAVQLELAAIARELGKIFPVEAGLLQQERNSLVELIQKCKWFDVLIQALKLKRLGEPVSLEPHWPQIFEAMQELQKKKWLIEYTLYSAMARLLGARISVPREEVQSLVAFTRKDASDGIVHLINAGFLAVLAADEVRHEAGTQLIMRTDNPENRVTPLPVTKEFLTRI